MNLNTQDCETLSDSVLAHVTSQRLALPRSSLRMSGLVETYEWVTLRQRISRFLATQGVHVRELQGICTRLLVRGYGTSEQKVGANKKKNW